MITYALKSYHILLCFKNNHIGLKSNNLVFKNNHLLYIVNVITRLINLHHILNIGQPHMKFSLKVSRLSMLNKRECIIIIIIIIIIISISIILNIIIIKLYFIFF